MSRRNLRRLAVNERDAAGETPKVTETETTNEGQGQPTRDERGRFLPSKG